jgi:putative inorganic carbon (HCO3(-)) transporter
MINSVWQSLTLMDLTAREWGRSSLLWEIVGLFRNWRQHSVLIQWGQQIAVVLLTLLFALAPFVPNSLIGLIAATCGGFWLLLTLADDTPRASKLTPIHLLILLYWSIAFVATALSPVKMAAAAGLAKLSLYLLVFVLVERVVRSPRWRSWLIAIYLHTALLVSVNGWHQKFFGAEALATWVDPESPTANVTRVYSYLGNPNLLAAYLLPAIPLSLGAVFAWRHWGPKALAVVMVVVNVTCLYWTGSRGGWIGLVVAGLVMVLLLLYWLLPRFPQPWRVWVFPLVLGGLAALVLVAIITVEPLRDRVLSIFAGREDSSNNFRINVWTSVLEMIRDRPWIGIGPGNTAFNQIYPLYQRPNFTALSAYSIFLELLVEMGVIGFGCFLWLLLVLVNQGCLQLQQLRRQQSDQIFWLIAAIATLFGMLAHGSVDTVWYRPEVATLWWFAIAVMTSYCTKPVQGINKKLVSDTSFG